MSFLHRENYQSCVCDACFGSPIAVKPTLKIPDVIPIPPPQPPSPLLLGETSEKVTSLHHSKCNCEKCSWLNSYIPHIDLSDTTTIPSKDLIKKYNTIFDEMKTMRKALNIIKEIS